jgi:phage terminase large subunit-like protein
MTQNSYACDPGAFIDDFVQKNEKGLPWRLTAYQRRVLALAFRWQQRGRTGEVRLCLRLLLWSEPKKSGKTFLAAALGLWWAFTRASTEVIAAANDLEQATSRVFATMAALCKHNPDLGDCVRVYATEIVVKNDTVIRAIASDYRGAAGSRHSLVIFDELWAFDSERARRLFEELTLPPTEPDAFVLVVTYAGLLGESELLESLYRRGLEGKRLDADLEVYDAGEMTMFWSHTSRQPWQTDAYKAEQARHLRPNTYLRLHENRFVSAEGSFITADLWDSNVDRTLTPALTDRSAWLFVGADAALKNDCGALAAVTWEGDKLRLVLHKIWKPTPGQALDLESTLEAELRSWHTRFTIRRIVVDPWQMARSIATLKAAGLPIEELPQTLPNLTAMGSALYEALRGHNLVLYADAELRQQALNTVAIDSTRGWKISKEKAGRKIDAIVALAMACYAALGSPAAALMPEGQRLECLASGATARPSEEPDLDEGIEEYDSFEPDGSRKWGRLDIF